MSEQNNAPQLELKKVYLKDCSFESPKSPYSFSQDQPTPVVNVQVTIGSKRLDPEQNFYEVVLNVTVTANQDEDQIVYLCEVQQAGLFVLNTDHEPTLEAMQGIACPSILLPYAREAIHNLVGKGGFEAVLINPMNFEAAFRQRKQAELEQAQKAEQDTQQDNEASSQSDETDKPTLN